MITLDLIGRSGKISTTTPSTLPLTSRYPDKQQTKKPKRIKKSRIATQNHPYKIKNKKTRNQHARPQFAMPTPTSIKNPKKILALKDIPKLLVTPTHQSASPRQKSNKTKKQDTSRQKRKNVFHSKTKRKAYRGRGAHRKRSGTAGKNRFLAILKSRINRNKSYPRAARRRGMTGIVHVSFTILRSGGVGHISINGPKIFYNSAKTAVRHAFPVNPAEAPFPLPKRISLSIRYNIR